MQAEGPRRSLVLSGGGARGAYEAGVLAYIFGQLPPALLAAGRLRVLCGTSVGAVNACFVAANAATPGHNMERLLDAWRGLRLEDLLQLSAWDLLRLPADLHSLFTSDQPSHGIILNATKLRELITQHIDWEQIRGNMRAGYLDAVTVSATHIASGKTVIFVDRIEGGAPVWSRDNHRLARGVQLGPEHALASAAIPILFPAVPIDGAFYCDGGLRQNTPLSPALRLGADRALVVAVGHGPEATVPEPAAPAESYPGPALLLGKVLNALLLDHLDYDLAQLEGFNRLLADGAEAFGPSFLTQLSKTAQRIRGASYRQVKTVVIRPSRDLGQMAATFVASGALDLSGTASWILRRLAVDDVAHHSDLLSYLAFDGRLAQQLIELGMHDADAARSALLEFFGP